MTCQACQSAEKNPATGLFQSDCPECKVRAVAQGPEFHNAQRIGRLTAEYKRVLTLAIGGDVQEAHAKVKTWAERLRGTI